MSRFETRSFFSGMGRALDLRASTFARHARGGRWHRSDAAAITDDWRSVWGDLGAAFARVRLRDGAWP